MSLQKDAEEAAGAVATELKSQIEFTGRQLDLKAQVRYKP